jgi:ribosome recycling factor
MNDVLKQTESKMKRTVDLLVKDYTTMRAGRATPALLEKVFADYYGTPTPINQMATISVPESRLLVIQPWDRNMVPQIEKAILKSDLGITPVSDGNVIRLAIPTLIHFLEEFLYFLYFPSYLSQFKITPVSPYNYENQSDDTYCQQR